MVPTFAAYPIFSLVDFFIAHLDLIQCLETPVVLGIGPLLMIIPNINLICLITSISYNCIEK